MERLPQTKQIISMHFSEDMGYVTDTLRAEARAQAEKRWMEIGKAVLDMADMVRPKNETGYLMQVTTDLDIRVFRGESDSGKSVIISSSRGIQDLWEPDGTGRMRRLLHRLQHYLSIPKGRLVEKL